jgi:RimJ/RimL family protein N-acetyltransferase
MLYGERVRLRGIEREDIPTFVRWFNDPEVRQYLLMFAPMSRASEEQWFESHLQRRDDYIFGVEVKTDAGWIHIGNVGLHQISWTHRSAVFGIVLGEKEYWGKGYGTDVARTILRFAFGELNLHRVQLEVFAENARAQRCYEKTGFKREGTRRQAIWRDGHYQDEHIMSILVEEFWATEHKAAKAPAKKGTIA